jgi:hypothetical protein
LLSKKNGGVNSVKKQVVVLFFSRLKRKANLPHSAMLADDNRHPRYYVCGYEIYKLEF